MKKALPILLFISIIILIVGLIHQKNISQDKNNIKEVRAVVLSAEDSNMVQQGIIKVGSQTLEIEITEGQFSGQRVKASNALAGKMEFDNYFKPGDKIIAAILIENNQIKTAKAVDLYRQDWQLMLFGLFVLSLLLYARFVGLKALFSFVASVFIVWTILIPGLLEGKNPIILSGLVLVILTAIIIFSVAGFTKTGIAAFGGTICGFLVTTIVTMLFGEKLALTGMTAPFSEALIYSGHFELNLKEILYASIIIGASGAAMDIAIDVAAAMEEIKLNNPEINMKELIKSGFNIGRAVIGTMSTTLLLAYSGGYLTLLMLFMTKNTSFLRIINMQIVSVEIIRTLAGSIGLVLVAPITAIIAAWILCKGAVAKRT